jgi:hypothetical protein
MPKTVTVTARIDIQGQRVVLSAIQSALPRPRTPLDTFLVQPGDTLQWELRNAEGAPTGFDDIQVRFVSAPIGGQALLTAGDLLRADGSAVIRGTVSDAASNGHYLYRFEQAGSPSGEARTLVCFWKRNANRTGMAGGEKEPQPVR